MGVKMSSNKKGRDCEKIELNHLRFSPYTKRRRLVGASLHTHAFWEICFLIRGSFINNINGDKIKLSANDFCFIRPKDVHYYSNPSKDIDYRDIYLTCEEMKYICDKFSSGFYDELEKGKFPIIYKMDLVHLTSIEKSISNFDFLDKKEEKYDEIFFNIVNRIFSIYLESKMDILSSVSKPQYFSNILEFIDDNPMEIDTAKVVEKLGYSYAHANRLFIKYTKMSLSKYLSLVKMRCAADMLLNQEITIVQISEMLGYSKQSSFNKAFKKVYNISPSKWRIK